MAIVALLIKKGAEINKPNNFGWTALHYAGKNEQDSVAEILLKNGAEIDDKNDLGFTPLHLAIFSKTNANVKLLLRYGADINASDIHGTTPLRSSISQNVNCNSSELLLQYGAQTDLKHQINGTTALHKAVYLRDKAKIGMLSRYGASMHIANKFGKTPLEWALDNYTGSINSLKIICYHN